MLKKLLKYDLISVFKYWWIAAASTLALSFLSGGCISIIKAEKAPALIMAMAVLVLIFSIFGLFAFCCLSGILAYIRFYKNFFTDEGYLTFTLPVKRSQLLNSKLITAVLVMFISFIIVIIDICIMLLAGGEGAVFKELAQFFVALFSEIDFSIGVHLAVFILEAIALIILLSVIQALFLFCCITFASLITKKAKVITAIGIYYITSSVVATFMQFTSLFGLTAASSWLSAIPKNAAPYSLHLVVIAITLVLTIVCGLLYLLEYYMLDKRLNLN